MADLSSRRPYLIRALYDWTLDNNLTPHLLVAADAPGVEVPRQFVADDGKITLNISPSAVKSLSLDNELIYFTARFSGTSREVLVPPGAVLALYARENGEGMLFGEVESSETASEEVLATDSTSDDKTAGHEKDKTSARGSRSHLRVVK